MSPSISRIYAIRLLSEVDLGNLTNEGRAEQLEIMVQENRDSDPGWTSIPAEVRAELETQRDIEQPSDSRYDPVLMLWLQAGYAGARNEYLAEQLRRLGHVVGEIIGDPDPLLPCPCCGLCTLGEAAA